MINFYAFDKDGKGLLRYYLYEGDGGSFVEQCDGVAKGNGGIPVRQPGDADVAIAPRLTRILKQDDLQAPRMGTLIFHPSLLPRHRGVDAVKQTLAAGAAFTGVTWFWADEGIDTGEVAEQQVVGIPRGVSAGKLYHEVLVPAGVVASRRVWAQLVMGYARRVGQDETCATYEGRLMTSG